MRRRFTKKDRKEYKKLKRIINQNDKMIKRQKFNKWKHYYTIEEFQNACAMTYNPKINDLDLYI